MKNNRIDEILNQIQADIEARRKAGYFPPGFEFGIEEQHRIELGKKPLDEIHQTQTILNHLEQLKIAMSELLETPEDSSRLRLVRIIRDTARVRHDLRATKRQLMEINRCLQQVLTDLLLRVDHDMSSVEKISDSVLTQVVERTLVNEQLVVLISDLESRVKQLETKPE